MTEKSNLAVCAAAATTAAVEAKDIEIRLEDRTLVDNGNNNPCPEVEIGAGVDPCCASDNEPRRDDPGGKDPNPEETDPKPN